MEKHVRHKNGFCHYIVPPSVLDLQVNSCKLNSPLNKTVAILVYQPTVGAPESGKYLRKLGHVYLYHKYIIFLYPPWNWN